MAPVASTTLMVSVTGTTGIAAPVISAGVDGARNHLVGDKCARRVVNENDVRRVTRKRLKTGANRRLPCRAAIHRRLIFEMAHRLIENIGVVRITDRLDGKHARMSTKRLHRPRKDGFSAD